MAMPAKDLTGKMFGYLTVIARHGTSKGKAKKATWLCRCACGTEVIRESQSLRSKHRPNARHCGCRSGEHTTVHGMSRTRPYRIWRGMVRRCTDANNKDFRNYGARGVLVCDRWRQSFSSFWDDMGPLYLPGLTLGRVDNNGPYSPENCRWETAKEQARNTRVNRLIETPAGTMTMTQASEIFGIAKGTLFARVVRYRWPTERALTEPVVKKRTTL